MRITGVKVRLIDIPFRVPPRFAYGLRPIQNFAIVQVRTDEGIEGLGEASCAGGPAWNEESIESVCRAHAGAAGLPFAKLAQGLRAALTGSLVSPGLFEIMRVLGRAEVLARIEDAAIGRNPALQ